MARTETTSDGRLAPVLALVTRASTLHVGGMATMAWLRSGLVGSGKLTAGDFDQAFAVGRLTPGTNLLAFYTTIGYQVSRWRGALVCLAVSTVLPSAIIVALSVLYVSHATNPLLARFMNGARAGAVAILAWTAGRLLVETVRSHWVRGAVLAACALGAVTVLHVPIVAVLLSAAGVGAMLFRDRP